MRGSRFRLLAALPAGIAILACACILATHHVVSERRSSTVEARGGAVRHGGSVAADEGAFGNVTDAGALDPLDSGEGSRKSSIGGSEGFLGELDALQTNGDSRPSVEFQERGDLITVAGSVLRAYADAPSVDLVVSGYLDLKGNVWGAVLRGGASWCDMVLVTTEDDAVSRVQITRVPPEARGD